MQHTPNAWAHKFPLVPPKHRIFALWDHFCFKVNEYLFVDILVECNKFHSDCCLQCKDHSEGNKRRNFSETCSSLSGVPE